MRNLGINRINMDDANKGIIESVNLFFKWELNCRSYVETQDMCTYVHSN